MISSIKLYYYTGSLVPGNECYCAGECVPSGMINNSACQFRSPFFISLPHFYKADPIYLDSVEGLQPDRSKHEAYVILEPVSLSTSNTLFLNLYRVVCL